MGAGDDIPGLLGLSRDYLNSQIGAWRSGQRKAAAPDCMDQVAKALTAQEVVAVTAWLSSRPALAAPGGHEALALPMPLLMTVGAAACFGLRFLAIRRGWQLPVAGGDSSAGHA